ncbi:MAG TPA: hypothetical protein VIU64_07545 [Polyangia bacterium]
MTALATAVVGAGSPPRAQAQLLGTGGTSGVGTTSGSSVFLGIQKVKNVNLNDLDRAIFLNRASCECKRTAWIKAVLNPSAVATAAQIPSTNRVTMWLGNNCDNALYTPSCHRLASTSFSDFRLNGLLVATDVSVIAQSYGAVVIPTDAGGSSGTAGTTGAGAGGGGGTTGGEGSGGAAGDSGTTVEIPPDDATKALCGSLVDGFTQTLWLFVGTNEGKNDTMSASLPLAMDVVPPPAPAKVSVSEANEALVVSWEAVDKTITSDLQGYQIFCTRADQYQVFRDGTFSTSIDTCGDTVSDGVPTAIQDRNTHFICSDFLSVSETSYRVKVLQNNIWYGVGVAAVDRQGNASPITPIYDHPVQTLDFYHQYRSGNPQGAATGGACSVAGEPSSGGGALAAFAATSIALTVRRRRGRRRRSEAPMGQPS